MVKKALTIAGSDSGGGAGIQADLKTFSALGVYGASAITAITAQNTTGVRAVLELPVDLIAAQIAAVVEDIGVDAVKVGMLGNARIIATVADQARQHALPNLILDPVMVAKSGDRLLQAEAIDALRAELLPLAALITPNIPEAEVLAEMPVREIADMRRAAEKLAAMGARGVVLKGGHLDGPATDVYFDGNDFSDFTVERVETGSTHGTGCTFSSAIAAFLALGNSMHDSVWRAKAYLTEALRHAYPLGRGHGPVHHFHRWWEG